jgi:hypothetical protein
MGDRAMVDAGPQHLKALERANRVRLARAALKRQIAAGERSAAEVIIASPWEAESMSISELLMSQRRWGRTRCRRVLLSLGLPENKQIGTMTERQRTALAVALTTKMGPPRPERPREESRPMELTLSPV